MIIVYIPDPRVVNPINKERSPGCPEGAKQERMVGNQYVQLGWLYSRPPAIES